MIEGLKLTVSGEELRTLLEVRVAYHERCAAGWAHENTRTKEDETDDAPLLPDHMCQNESERHLWRRDVLRFIRDHVEAGETYRLGARDLEPGELLPPKPGWLDQDEFEERTRVGFALERMTRSLDVLAAATDRGLARGPREPAEDAGQPTAASEEPTEFTTTRLEPTDGLEVMVIERK